MTPSRRLNNVPQLIGPALGALDVPPHGCVFPKGDLEHLVGFDVFGQSVGHGLFSDFLGEGAEETVPNNERGTMIPVEIAYIRSVVDAVV